MMWNEFTMLPVFPYFVTLIAVWDLAWKGVGMWRASKKSHLGWFVVMLIINSAGIIPIIYLAFFHKRVKKVAKKAKKKK